MKKARTIYLLKRVEAASRAMLDSRLRELGLTAGQYTTLSLLAGNERLSSADLARRALISPQSMFEMITTLEKKGLIQRVASEANRRILEIALSSEGKHLLAAADVRVDELEKALFAPFDKSRLSALRDALNTVLDASPLQKS